MECMGCGGWDGCRGHVHGGAAVAHASDAALMWLQYAGQDISDARQRRMGQACTCVHARTVTGSPHVSLVQHDMWGQECAYRTCSAGLLVRATSSLG
jgi:hypothetical protein